jgi:hypothetical protein
MSSTVAVLKDGTIQWPHEVRISTYLDWEKIDEHTWSASMNYFFSAVICRNEWSIYVCDVQKEGGTFPKGTTRPSEKFAYVQRAFTIMIQAIN